MTTFANAITHPVVFFGFMQSSLPYIWAILLAEVFAVFGETVLHSLTFVKPLFRTVGPATLANLVSWQLAPILTYFLIFN